MLLIARAAAPAAAAGRDRPLRDRARGLLINVPLPPRGYWARSPSSRGFNSNGQLGDGTTTTSSAPVKVALQLYTATTSRRRTAWCGPAGRRPHLGNATARASLLLGHPIRIRSRESPLPMGESPRLGPDPLWLAAFLSSPNWRPSPVGRGDQDFVREFPPRSNGGQPCSEDGPLP